MWLRGIFVVTLLACVSFSLGSSSVKGPKRVVSGRECKTPFMLEFSDSGNRPTVTMTSGDQQMIAVAAASHPELANSTILRANFTTPERGHLRKGRDHVFCFRSVGASVLVHCVTVHIHRCAICARKGDSLYTIAASHGTKWAQLLSANQHITNPDTISEGELIILGNVYVLEFGDTLMSVAAKFGVTVNSIFRWNPYLTALSDTSSGRNNKYSRQIPAGHEVCVLPNVCPELSGTVPLWAKADGRRDPNVFSSV